MFANINVERDGLHNLAAELRAIGPYVQRHGPPVVRAQAKKLQQAVKAHAQGRPGPRRVTGKYVESIKVRSGIGGGVYTSRAGRIPMGFEAEVYTNEPYARRLEFGFVGVDSAGRHYNQPPYPHWGPAVAEVNGGFGVAIDTVVTRAVMKATRHVG